MAIPKTLTAIRRHIRGLAKRSPVEFGLSRIANVIAKRRRPTNAVRFEAMMDGPKYVLIETPMTPEQLLTTEAGLEKIARLIEPVAWAEYDAAPKGDKPDTKKVPNCDIAAIVRSQKAANRLAIYLLLHTEPELGQNPSGRK